MPKSKKASPFMTFAKERYPNLPINVAVSKAGKEWESMSKEKREKYVEKCKNTLFMVPKRELLTSQGVPISFVEKEKQELIKKEYSMKTEIEDIVISGRDTGNLADITFNFISVNYFSQTADGSIYTPAEIGISAYSLRDGVKNRYHSLVNPLTVPYGHAFETKTHSERTHQLGVPPDVQGETNLKKLYLNCLEFIRENNECGSEYPPLFTHQDEKIVKSVLEVLRSDCYDEEPVLRVYPLRELFFILKRTTSEIGETKPPESKHITNAYLDKDVYEYQVNIACDFHEKKDCAKYCALSCVTRWAYTLSDHLCKDLALDMEPGHHIPKDADCMSYTFSESNFDSSVVTQPKIEREHFNISKSTSLSTIEHFPSLKDSKKKSGRTNNMDNTMTTNSLCDHFDNESSSNPWMRRKISRRPAEESFSIDIGECDEFPRIPSSSGRGLLFSRVVEEAKTSRGRGLAFGD
ncbi:protein maelstrom 2-like [Condylostylus longicornis]|uniref:protein maelstrom 2-like n=1 Tax=Condylostylus longicornis TaxID=2530218 RepID=UPI00244DC132|nr:protein maelstrom 2-like [Condylostylus longicornis]